MHSSKMGLETITSTVLKLLPVLTKLDWHVEGSENGAGLVWGVLCNLQPFSTSRSQSGHAQLQDGLINHHLNCCETNACIAKT